MDDVSDEFRAILCALEAQHVKELESLRQTLGCASGASRASTSQQQAAGVVHRSSQERCLAPLRVGSKGGTPRRKTDMTICTSNIPPNQGDESPGSPTSAKGVQTFESRETHSLVSQLERRVADISRELVLEAKLRSSEAANATASLFVRVQDFLQSYKFESFITFALGLNVIFMATEMQLEGMMLGSRLAFYDKAQVPFEDSWESIGSTFFIIDLLFTLLFALDVVVRISILRCKFFRLVMNWVDFIVVVSSVSFATFKESLPIDPVLIRLLRLGKLARAMRMVELSKSLDSLQLLLKCLFSSVAMLFWSFLLLIFMQCVAGMVISNLARGFMDVPANDAHQLAVQQNVFLYYGTFTRTLLTTFEVLFANWAPPCRVLVDNVSEWFSLVFLFYRCVIGFAVLNVVNAVFVQQSMKVAAADEEHAFKQRSKDHRTYTELIKRLFEHLDVSGDGEITLDEFEELCQVPKLQFWLSRLDLEYHDLLGLFQLLDDGDGSISLDEFTRGIFRLKGHAKSIDVWRMETRLEEIMAKLSGGSDGDAKLGGTRL
eukprot:TRINITY_DN15556_c0_g1_i2.p1 TRINITY_DN15556_c0_g1~~TRINITY_DN15556_c0_g1_i2.p1  ORF type:complete len:557 (-),score=74.73 TRINITY_DN15556_c0_g1_i2:348-1988(-)